MSWLRSAGRSVKKPAVKVLSRWMPRELIRRDWILGELCFQIWLGYAQMEVFWARARGRLIVLDADYYRLEIGDFHRALGQMKRLHLVQIPRARFEKSFDYGRAFSAVDGRSPGDLFDLVWDGIPMRNAYATKVAADTCYLDFEHAVNLNPDQLRADWSFGICAYEATKRAIHRLRPDAMLNYQGAFAASRLLREAAVRANLPVVAVENCFIGDRVYLDGEDGMILNRFSLAKRGREYRELRASRVGAAAQAVAMWESGFSRKIADHRAGGIDSAEEFSARFGFDLEHPFILILAQVQIDAAIMLDSPLWPNSIDFYELAVRLCRICGYPVVVRFHPRESMVHPDPLRPFEPSYNQLKERLGSLEGVCLVPGKEVKTYTLIQAATACVTINSQSGLEAALFGKTVVTAGTCLYSGNGFTIDVAHPSALSSALETAWNQGKARPVDPDIAQRAGTFILDLAETCMPRRDLVGDEGLVLRQFGKRG